jgi:hypothetical protein
MIRPSFCIPIFALLAACAGVNSTKPSQTPRIQLQPSPASGPLRGAGELEVLDSGKTSGAYIAITDAVPVTRYFYVLRSANCDDWVYVQLVSPAAIRSNPEYYVGGKYSEDKPFVKCMAIFHKKYRNESDQNLAGSDGVLFDVSTMKITEPYGFWISEKKVFMNGWAIKFADPTPDEVRRRLATKAYDSKIDVAQVKALAYWIEKTNSSQYAAALIAALPLDTPYRAVNGWRGGDVALLGALAAVEPASASIEPYLKIMEAGIVNEITPGGSKISVGDAAIGLAPLIAANILACRNRPGTAERLAHVLKHASIVQHRLGAARALIAMGKRDVLQKMVVGNGLGDMTPSIYGMLAGHDSALITCPYRGFSQ